MGKILKIPEKLIHTNIAIHWTIKFALFMSSDQRKNANKKNRHLVKNRKNITFVIIYANFE